MISTEIKISKNNLDFDQTTELQNNYYIPLYEFLKNLVDQGIILNVATEQINEYDGEITCTYFSISQEKADQLLSILQDRSNEFPIAMHESQGSTVTFSQHADVDFDEVYDTVEVIGEPYVILGQPYPA